MYMNFILWMLMTAVAINLIMFVPAYIYKTDKLTDISYAITFIVVALAGYFKSQETLSQLIVLILVFLWALRLGGFLFIRIRRLKKDNRFDGIREKFFVFIRFWVLQGVSVFIILIPSILLWRQTTTTIGWVSIIGAAIFASGLLLEATADIQKYRFYIQKKSDTWIDSGVWRASRHPNYLGESMVWLGIYLFLFASLSADQKLVALIGPLYIICLLLFVSGIPLLEKSANKKWGANKKYLEYKSEVPVFIPSISSLRRILHNKYN